MTCGVADQRRDDRVGDLVLDQRRAAPHPLGEDDDLRIGEIRDGVQLHLLIDDQRRDQREADAEQDEQAVARAELDDFFDHDGAPQRQGFGIAFLQSSSIVPIPRCWTSQARHAWYLSGNFVRVEVRVAGRRRAAGAALGAPSPDVCPSMAARRRLSESIRKLPVVTTVSPSDDAAQDLDAVLGARADLHQPRLEVAALLGDEEVLRLAGVDDRLRRDHQAGGGRQVQRDVAVHAGAQARSVAVEAVLELEPHASACGCSASSDRVDELAPSRCALSPGNDASSRRAVWPTWTREMSCS